MKIILERTRWPAIAMAASLIALPAQAETKNVIIQWNEVLLQAVRHDNPGPPMVARSLAITHTCMYDAWAAFDDRAVGTELGAALRRPRGERTDENKRQAISFAAYSAAIDLFPGQQAKFDTLMSALGYDPADSHKVDLESAAGVGLIACAAVLEKRHRDGSNQLGDLHPGAYSDYTGYKAYNTPDDIIDANYWQPLRVADGQGGYKVQTFLAPHWGRVKPFSFNSPKKFKLKKPAKYGSREFLEQAREVISYSAHLTDTQKVKAEYWADGPHSETPPGHWNLLAQHVSRRDQHTLDQDAKLFFALNNAVMDAGIWAWWAKREFDYVRPISAIHYLFKGQMIEAWAGRDLGTRPILGETWRPYQAENFVTPPFAEYVSGHSSFSASAAQVLRRFTGSDVFGYAVTFEPGSSFVEPGTVPANRLKLTYATFSDAADEAGISRRFGGIHFRDGDLEARRVGREIGELVWKRASHLFRDRGK
ncbi:vanadium-dependent haloperoxidase [Allohahella sp. A8]|uniref:vanadium-dependent haloperoxidase n=1 Tax=Allohahella sp. A8 TaxID=3141461 RepID=UPI003A800C11